MTSPGFSAPEPLLPSHDVEPFECGVPSLDAWLKERGTAGESSGVARTYGIHVDSRIIGYYALASGAVERDQVTGAIRRNMPDPIPVVVLGRLAIDLKHQRQGLGQALLRDAIFRVLRAAGVIGVRAILVQAISDEAKRFYQAFGFVESPTDPMLRLLPLNAARSILTE